MVTLILWCSLHSPEYFSNPNTLIFTTKCTSEVLYLSFCHTMYNYVGFSPQIQPIRKSVTTKWYSRAWCEHICVWEGETEAAPACTGSRSNQQLHNRAYLLFTEHEHCCEGFNLVSYLARVESAWTLSLTLLGSYPYNLRNFGKLPIFFEPFCPCP